METKQKKPRTHLSIDYDAKEEIQKDNGILPSSALGDVLEQADNAALAIAYIPKGSPLIVEGKLVKGKCEHDIPEGHRFTYTSVKEGESLRSWGIPFGIALQALEPGTLLENAKSLMTFADRKSPLSLPSQPNFKNAPFKRFEVSEDTFVPGQPTNAVYSTDLGVNDATFDGFVRGEGRGVGTRNYVVIVGTSGRVAGLVRMLEKKFEYTVKNARVAMPNVSFHGVVAIAHTEGSQDQTAQEDLPNNYEKLLRTLAGFCVHSNVGGVLLVDQGNEVVTCKAITSYMTDKNFPIHPNMLTMSVGNRSIEEVKQDASDKILTLIEKAKQCKSTPSPISNIILAQQCGGSDAFSGISANPLAGWLARYLVCFGGSSILAETDELIGAEGYLMSCCKDVATAKKFLNLVDRFYKYTNIRGHSPEGNPSGGNLFRGLYNITLKSAGAAMKKLPNVRLDEVLEYGERLQERKGYVFMDSPGNDLESIAGQVASGSNVILFTTGNGSVTNFPFVPTLKALTTTARFDLLSEDMDINAGLYIDGTKTLDELGESAISLLLKVASGIATKGELAGHHQVQMWRNWSAVEGDDSGEDYTIKQESTSEVQTHRETSQENDSPDAIKPGKALEVGHSHISQIEELDQIFENISLLEVGMNTNISVCSGKGYVSDRVGLILPTSLCSSQVALRIAEMLNKEKQDSSKHVFENISHFVALPHTEGCGHSSGDHEALVLRTLMGYVHHPLVGSVVLLEHGCEKTHNGRMQQEIDAMGLGADRFGFASVQADGGFKKVSEKVRDIFLDTEKNLTAMAIKANTSTLPRVHPPKPATKFLRVGVLSASSKAHTPEVLKAVAEVCECIVNGGGLVVIGGALTHAGGTFFQNMLASGEDPSHATLGYGQQPKGQGLHIMSTSSTDISELMCGVGACGVEVMVVLCDGSYAPPTHALVPTLLCAPVLPTSSAQSLDIDVRFIHDDETHAFDSDKLAHAWACQLSNALVKTISHQSTPKMLAAGVTEFKIARAFNAVSL